jgi:hypothetical protein
MVASVGTPRLQQISLMNNAVLDKIEETPDLSGKHNAREEPT